MKESIPPRIRRLRYWLPAALLLLITLSGQQVIAQLVNGRFVTSFYTWKKFDTVGVSNTYLRAFQTIQLSIAQGDVSLHTYLQGATNATNSFGDIGRFRFYNLFLKWANIGNVGDLSLGRQAVYAGVGNGTIDGVVAKVRLGQDKVTLTGYGGATVRSDFTKIQKNFHDNYNVGGQLVATPVSDVRIGLSFMSRKEEREPYWTLRARDTTFTPVAYYIANESPAEEYGSVDVYFSSPRAFSMYGRYDYDFYLKKTSRGQGGARLFLSDALDLTMDFIHREPRIAFNSIFSAFTSNAVDEFEAGLEYGFTPLLRAFGKLAFVSFVDEETHRWTLGLNAGYGSVSYSGSDGYPGHLQSFNIQGAYPLFDKLIIPSLGVSYASYRLSTDNSLDDAWTVVLGSTVRPSKSFSFDVQGQLLANKIVKHDTRLFAKLNYWFAERLSFFQEEVKQ
jgi:hypothetical protein